MARYPSEKQRGIIRRAEAVAIFQEYGYLYWDREDGSVVLLADLILHNIETAPRYSRAALPVLLRVEHSLSAQGIEARQRHDPAEGRGPQDESPVGATRGDAPNL